MFLFKKILAPFFYPIPFSLILIMLGLFIFHKRRKKAGSIIFLTGLCLFILLSFNPVSNIIIHPLEYRYESYGLKCADGPSVTNSTPVDYVVVLGGGHISDPAISITSQINPPTLVRLIEGIRILKENPGSRLVLSGGSVFDLVSEADIMMEVALICGVRETDIILESKSRDTKDQALFVKDIVGNHPFALVTSAVHIPRSVALFRKQGMNPIPAPTMHLKRKKQKINPGLFFPNAKALRKSENAFHEYIGLIWAKLRGQI